MVTGLREPAFRSPFRARRYDSRVSPGSTPAAGDEGGGAGGAARGGAGRGVQRRGGERGPREGRRAREGAGKEGEGKTAVDRAGLGQTARGAALWRRACSAALRAMGEAVTGLDALKSLVN